MPPPLSPATTHTQHLSAQDNLWQPSNDDTATWDVASVHSYLLVCPAPPTDVSHSRSALSTPISRP